MCVTLEKPPHNQNETFREHSQNVTSEEDQKIPVLDYRLVFRHLSDSHAQTACLGRSVCHDEWVSVCVCVISRDMCVLLTSRTYVVSGRERDRLAV